MNLFPLIPALFLTALLIAPALVVFEQCILRDRLDGIFAQEHEHGFLELDPVQMLVLVHVVVQLGPHHQTHFIGETLLCPA